MGNGLSMDQIQLLSTNKYKYLNYGIIGTQNSLKIFFEI